MTDDIPIAMSETSLHAKDVIPRANIIPNNNANGSAMIIFKER